jgi:cytochrome c-type biogenesis protein CcmF
LSFGLILGGRWAYEELGWGGYWAWDPVENAGLMPWFTATAFLHSAIIQEQRGQMKIWNLLLVILTFFLTIFGTFMTRSGAVQSVHAFGEDNILALQFIVFLALILIVSLGLLVYRANKLSTRMQFESFLSREYAFLMNNWILLACAFFVLFATMFPTISEAIDGSRVSVGPEFFNKWMTPLGLTLLVLAGAAPLLAWRRTTRERLVHQFLIPGLVSGATVVGLAIFVPESRHLSSIFSQDLELPIALVNFGIIAFLAASIFQEFFRGVMVRQKQTGGDPLTSLLGLVLAKRRKYGGYIVHLGVAVLFLGFAGKAYDHMADRVVPVSLAQEKQAFDHVPANDKAWFEFSGYRFQYRALQQTSDDHKIATTAYLELFHDGDDLGPLYPGKSDYQKADQQAVTDVAIDSRFAEDVYVVLNGYDLDSQQASFRVFINPMILWVWVGFLILWFGVAICMIPEWVVRWGSKPRKTRVGRAADVAVLIAIAIGVPMAIASQAHAAGPTTAEHAAEHVPEGQGMGNDSQDFASQFRPTSPTAEKIMKELLCQCGCPRESIFSCKCGTAAKLRQQVLGLLAGYDLKSSDGRDKAYDDVLARFVKDYGGEQVLATPRNSASWLFPSIAVVGGLALLVVGGRRWVTRGKAAAPRAAAHADAPEDDAYADKLDDELRDAE